MTRRRLIVLGAAVTAVAVAAALWHWQSEVIGIGARWYLARIAASEEARGDLTRRREIVSQMNRVLFMSPPPDALVPELFDLITAVSSRVATGEINVNWAAYVYSDYQRDMVRDRPGGTPRRSMAQVVAAVDEYVRFYTLQRRPDVPGVRLRDLVGPPTESSPLKAIGPTHPAKDRGRGSPPDH
jgi:hypothetical protein